MKMKYIVEDEVSGDSLEVEAKSPKEASIKYLKNDIEPSLKSDTWNWSLTVSRKYPQCKLSC